MFMVGVNSLRILFVSINTDPMGTLILLSNSITIGAVGPECSGEHQ